MNVVLEAETTARPRHMRGILPLVLWLCTYFGLIALWDALQTPHPQPALRLALVQMVQVAVAPLFARWILARVYNARVFDAQNDLPRRERTVVRVVDGIALAWAGYIAGVWLTLLHLQAAGVFERCKNNLMR